MHFITKLFTIYNYLHFNYLHFQLFTFLESYPNNSLLHDATIQIADQSALQLRIPVTLYVRHLDARISFPDSRMDAAVRPIEVAILPFRTIPRSHVYDSCSSLSHRCRCRDYRTYCRPRWLDDTYPALDSVSSFVPTSDPNTKTHLRSETEISMSRSVELQS